MRTLNQVESSGQLLLKELLKQHYFEFRTARLPYIFGYLHSI